MNRNKYDEAKELVDEFIKEYLDGDIEKLKTFSFWAISGNPKFDGTCEQKFSSGFDGDRTKIVYAIDRLIYKGLPNFDCDFGVNYSGETINTFNTLFGKELDTRQKIKNLFTEDEWKNIEDENQKGICYADDFYHVYQRIGNFMLFPCKTIYIKSLNLYKGSYDADYIDLFFKQFKERLQYNGNKQDTLRQIIDANNFFFTKDMTYDKFLKSFFLEKYENLSFGSEHFYHWYPNLDSNKNIQKRYKEFSLNYIAEAKRLINNRSEIIVKKLNGELNH